MNTIDFNWNIKIETPNGQRKDLKSIGAMFLNVNHSSHSIGIDQLE